MSKAEDDLDAFLHGVESKLRGPYSSLEFSKAVTTPVLRGSLSSKDYLRLVSETLSRPDKVVQVRILVGLLGLDPAPDLDGDVYNILKQAQEAPLHEEWVRVIAGLVSGVMFVDVEKEKNLMIADESSIVRTCRGEEASKLLDQTCNDILDSVKKFERETELPVDNQNNNNNINNDSNKASCSILTTDMYPLFIPFRYSLLNPDLLQQVAPECTANVHFQVNDEADALTKDAKLEKQKALEEKEHIMNLEAEQNKKNNEDPLKNNKNNKESQVFLPGGGKKTSASAAAKSKIRSKTQNTMFLTSKRPGMAGRPGMGRQPVKSALHTRKAGAAKALLENNRSRSLKMAGSRGPNSSLAGNRANNKSKMMMIDVAEVEGLNNKSRGGKMSREDKKRKIREAAAQRMGLVSRTAKAQKTNSFQQSSHLGNNNNNSNNETPSTSLFDHELPEDNNFNMNNTVTTNNAAKQQEWRQLLNQRSNKLSADDRSRVEQFFQNHYNPTPEMSVYKMKLHEERTTDANTGKEVKETYYLELDYNSFTSKQSKKIKRYD